MTKNSNQGGPALEEKKMESAGIEPTVAVPTSQPAQMLVAQTTRLVRTRLSFYLEGEIGAMLLFFMLMKSAILCDLYLLTYIINFVRLKHLAMQTCFYHLSPYIFSIAGAIFKRRICD